MPDLRSYAAGLEREITAPDFAGLERVATRRARLKVTAGLALSTAALAALVLVTGRPDGDRGSLPAVSPTTGPLSSLDADEIVERSPGASETVTSDDGVDATLTSHQLCATDTEASSGKEGCRLAYRVTGPGGVHRSYVLTRPDESLGPVAYLGRGEFLVYCTVCGDDNDLYVVSASLDQPRRLDADPRATRPGPGRTLVPCRGDACIFDRTTRTLTRLDLASLPFWIDELQRHSWFTQEPGIETLPGGQVYIPPDILFGGGTRPSPALVVVPGRVARELTPLRTKVPARAGLVGWVTGNGQGVDCPCVVDAEKATIAEVDLPTDSSLWARSNGQGWWGLSDDQQTAWVFVDGSPQEVAVPRRSPDRGLNLADGDPTVVAYVESVRNDHADPSLYLHASLDRGRTWRTVVMPISALASDERDGRVRLDPTWRTWPEAG